MYLNEHINKTPSFHARRKGGSLTLVLRALSLSVLILILSFDVICYSRNELLENGISTGMHANGHNSSQRFEEEVLRPCRGSDRRARWSTAQRSFHAQGEK